MLRRKLVRNHLSGQVVLPKDYLRNLGWHFGDTLYIRQVGDRLIVDKKKKVL